MKYMLLIYADANGWDELSEDEQRAIYRDYMAVTDDPAVRCGRPRCRARDRGAHPGRAPRRRDRGPPGAGAVAILDRVFKEEWGRVLASLIGFLGDFDLAEEAAQEAFAVAAERWPRYGVPANPAAWLVTTARNRAIDRIRRERVLRREDPAPDERPRPPATAHRRRHRPSPTSAWS